MARRLVSLTLLSTAVLAMTCQNALAQDRCKPGWGMSEGCVRQAGGSADQYNLTPEQRTEIESRIENRFGDLAPEERQQRLNDLRTRRAAIREELLSLPPEERAIRMKTLRQEFHQEFNAGEDPELNTDLDTILDGDL